LWWGIAALLACGSVTLEAAAQVYPAKPIRIVSALPNGNSGEVAARLITNQLSASTGQPVIFENRQGANGAVAVAYAKTLPSDGYSLLYVSSSTLVTGRFLNKALDFDPLLEFTPITLAVGVPVFLAVHSSVPVESIKDLIDYARRNPGKLAYGSPGLGSLFHLTGESLKMANGIDLLHVPYSGGGMGIVVNDFVTGRIQVLFPSYVLIRPHLDSGAVKMLGSFSTQRDKRLPNVPTVNEALPDTKIVPSWFSFFAPAGVPSAIARKAQAAIAAALQHPEVAAKLEDLGMTPVGSSPEELAAAVTAGIADMTTVTAVLGIKPN
jgi:tripartite-type tricarboxylate transporter receptor subunit TctC